MSQLADKVQKALEENPIEADDSSLAPQPQPTGEQTMSTPNPTLGAVTKNLKHGAKIAGSEEACKILVSVIRKSIGDSYPEFFNTEIGRLVEPLVMASIVHYLAVEYTFLPKSELVAKVAEYCMQGTGREAMHVLLKQLEPAFEQISKISLMEKA